MNCFMWVSVPMYTYNYKQGLWQDKKNDQLMIIHWIKSTQAMYQ